MNENTGNDLGGNAKISGEPGERYIQVGVTALRDPKTHEYLPAVPIYIREDASGAQGQETLIADIGKLLANRMRCYQKECIANGVPI